MYEYSASIYQRIQKRIIRSFAVCSRLLRGAASRGEMSRCAFNSMIRSLIIHSEYLSGAHAFSAQMAM